MRRALTLLLVLGLTTGAACNKKSPIDPSILALTSSGTRLITLSGDIAFGSVPVGTTATRELTITNTGTGAVALTAILAESGTGTLGFQNNFTPTTLAPGTTKTVSIVFAPTIAQGYGFFLTVQGNQTSTSSTVIVDGTGSADHLPLFTKSGFGNAVFDLPTYISQIRVTGHFVDTGDISNFVVLRNSTLEINEVLRTADFDVTGKMPGGGRVQIINSPSIAWTFTEVR